MGERQWTAEQAQCVYSDGGTLLVSAAAGSGKTTVLVSRIIEKVTRAKNPVDIDRLMVVTFTRAAAAEMKQRLTVALSQALAKDPTSARLQRQQMLLPRANISTVDGFCTTLVREYFHMLDLSPRFRVGEGGELRLLREEALTETVEALYAAADPAFRELSALLNSRSGDRGLYAVLEQIYDCIQAHPFPSRWLRAAQEMYDPLTPIADTPWGKQALRLFEEGVAGCRSLAAAACRLAETDAQLTAAYLPAFAEVHDRLATLAQRLPEMSWDERLQNVTDFAFPRLSSVRRATDELTKERAKALWDKLKKDMKELPALLCGTELECAEDRAALRPMVAVLCEAVEQFDARFTEKKRARDLVDFADIEHMALHLLVAVAEDGTVSRTPLAQELAAQYDEVMVDEYQDTNATQDALFSALSREESNLFLVGDVKQSIYGFRQAMPKLFIGRRDRYPLFDGEQYPATVLLGHNFRSRREVTDAVNTIFRQLMTRETGGIVYDEREELVPAAAHYAPKEGYETELLVLTGKPDSQDSTDAAEARLIAARIRELLTTLTVTDKDGERPARYGDFCILLRSANTHAAAYVDELKRQGIPAFTEKSGGFFDASEVLLALSLLRLINNPLQEVPLLAVLLSPIAGLTPDDLSEIRLILPYAPLWLAVREKARANDALGERCAAFDSFLQRMRVLAATLPADRLIGRVYEETGLLLWQGARVHGAQRVANLHLLQEYAASYEQNGLRGLGAFVRYMDRLMEREAALPPAATATGDADVVRVMSIHSSKGLEFPFVFVARLGGQFNNESTNGKVLLHPDHGFGMRRRHADTLLEHTTLPLEGVKRAIRRSERTEELRVLYVALTRAKEKLILVTSVTDSTKKLASLAAQVGEEPTLPAHLILEASGMGDWILAALLRHPYGGVLRQCAGWNDPPAPVEALCPWRVELCAIPPTEEAAVQERAPLPPPDGALKETLLERFTYTYPYAALLEVPTKQAASALSHRQVEERYAASARPAFLTRSGMTPTERGSAMHAFMQFSHYEAAAQNVEEEIARLVTAAFLTQEQADSLSRPRLRAFFESDLYRRMAASPRCLREYPFTVSVPVMAWDAALAATLPADAQQEEVVIQGIADCLFEENGRLTVVDYKTDRVDTTQELIDRYCTQLQVYAFALQRTLGVEVAQCLLYSFALGRTVEVPVADVLENIFKNTTE